MAKSIDSSSISIQRFDIEKIGEVFGSVLLAPSVLPELQFDKNESKLNFNFEHQGMLNSGNTKTRIEKESNYLNLVIKLPNSSCFHIGTKKLQQSEQPQQQILNFHKLDLSKTNESPLDVLEKIWNFAEKIFGENNFNVDENYSCSKERVDIKIKHKTESKMITITFKKLKNEEENENNVGV